LRSGRTVRQRNETAGSGVQNDHQTEKPRSPLMSPTRGGNAFRFLMFFVLKLHGATLAKSCS
jgi:hypothetical protein